MNIMLSMKMIEVQSEVRRKSRLLSNYFIKKKSMKIKENCLIIIKKIIEWFVSMKFFNIYTTSSLVLLI